MRRVRLASLIDTIWETMIAYVTVVLGASMVVAASESWNFGDTLWWAVVTSFTVGYGDLAPHTLVGRLVAAFMIAATWFFSLLLGAQIAAKLIVNSDAWTHAEQEEVKAILRELRNKK